MILTGCLAALFLNTSCDVHEFPHEEPEPPEPTHRQVRLKLEFDLEMPIFQEIEYENGLMRTRGDEILERRYIVRAYPVSRSEITRSEVASWEFFGPAEQTDTYLDLEVPDGELCFLVWSDFVNASQRNDRHYDSSDFASVMLRDSRNHPGSDETRDAFRGELNLPADADSGVIPMVRPMARYRFITNDLDLFVDKELEARSTRDGTKADDIDLTQYGVRFTYPRYMAYSFNMFTNRPADSWTNIRYESSLKAIDGKHAELGFDYVFVNSHDTSVNVMVEVYDRRTGVVLARIQPVDVPLSRSKLTTVRGSFLTTHAEGGAGIDPDFDGEFNIEIK